jgi:DNA primase
MSSNDVREVKSRLNIADVVGDYVSLRKTGETYWGKCPFHSEKTPSFSVSEKRQTFHCFGCGKGGDIFTFVMEMEGLEFREALEKLAAMAGVRLSARSERTRRKIAVNDINSAALDFFRRSLEGAGGAPARAYLERRNITKLAASDFELGWAPQSWSALLDELKVLGFGGRDAVESGLAIEGTRGPYDRFRGRVMFPIRDAAGRLIGFGGRILDGDGAKYLNSPESAVFNKRYNLYLLDRAKHSMRTKGAAILVEGYMDAIRAHMKGFTNAIASLGTALTENQASLIKRMTDLCYICYDSDAAGEEAALRGMYVLQREGVEVRVVRLEKDRDPDDVLSEPDGSKVFQAALEASLPLPVYHAVLRAPDLKIPDRAASARDDLLDGLASLSPFEISPHLDRIGRAVGLYPHELNAEIAARRERAERRTRARAPEKMPVPAPEEPEAEVPPLECQLCSMLWTDETLRSESRPEDIVPFIKDFTAQNIASALLTGEEPAVLEERWRQMGDDKSLSLIAKGNGLLERERLKPGAEYLDAVVKAMRRNCMKERLYALQRKIKSGKATPEEFKEHMELSGMLKGGALKNGKRR